MKYIKSIILVYINNLVALQEPSPAEEPSSKTGRGSIPKAAVPKAEKGRGTKPKKAAPAQPAGKTAAKQEEPAGKTAAKQEEQVVQAEEVPAGKPAAKQGKQAVKAQVPAAVPAAKPAVVKPPPWRQAAAVQPKAPGEPSVRPPAGPKAPGDTGSPEDRGTGSSSAELTPCFAHGVASVHRCR